MTSFNQTFIISIIVITALSVIIPVLSYLLSEKTPDKEKSSVYECGFSPMYQPGKPFSIRFFIIAILFLVFDLEIILLFPWSISLNSLLEGGLITSLIFFVILAVGLTYE
jgi:NADH:ubiquinone oxidoreductase subunit 3 (subunit A)